MDKQELMDWLNYMDELLGEQFSDIMKYEITYPKIIAGLIAKKSALANEMDSAYEILAEL